MDSAQKIKVLIMAGGTGGHVFPALAVARELQSRGAEIMWLGTQRGLESEVIPKAGIPITFVNIAGLRGNGVLGWLLAPGRILLALIQVIKGIQKFDPAVVLGMGGFVTGPGGVGAWLLRIPLVIHEQNAIAGLTNKLLVPFSKRVLEAFPNTFEKKGVYHTGNPVRQDIVELNKEQTDSLDELRLLVVGGSLGAKALNETVPAAIKRLSGQKQVSVWHQTGKKLVDETLKIYKELELEAKVEPFIHDMAEAYGWADIVICRAGALTIAELAAAGLPSILVPYPYAVDDHQTANAKYLTDQEAAIVIQQSELTADVLMQHLLTIGKEKLAKMGVAAKRLALPNATAVVADHCLDLAHA